MEANTNTTNQNKSVNTERADRMFNTLNTAIEELHPTKEKTPKKPAVINQAKKILENIDLQEAIKKLRNEGRSISRIEEVLNVKLRNNFDIRIKQVPVDMFIKNSRQIPAGNRITKEVTDSKTKKIRTAEFVEIESKDKFTVSMIQKLLGEEKKTRKKKVNVTSQKNETPTQPTIDSILDSLAA